MKLNLGCGSDLRDGYVNVDRVKLDGVDVVHDLDVGPWPFPDESCDGIIAQDVFEHVADPILFMVESWRVLMLGAGLVLKVPYWASRDAFTDPTHRRFCTEHTFDYWTVGTFLYDRNNPAYGGVRFHRERLERVQDSLFVHLEKAI